MKIRRWPIVWILLSVWSLLMMWSGPIPLRAQNAATLAASPGLEERLAALEQALQMMEARLAALESAPAVNANAAAVQDAGITLAALRQTVQTATAPVLPPEARSQQERPAPASSAIVTASQDGFSIQSTDGRFRFKPRYQFQIDGLFAANENGVPVSKTLIPRRVQPILEGTLFKYFNFRFLSDFARGQVSMRDAYMDITLSPATIVRVGKFKTPFGWERMMSGFSMPLMERSIATQLTPNRDLGIELHGEVQDGLVEYAAGVFNGVRDGGGDDFDPDGNKDFATRWIFRPFQLTPAKALHGLALGFGSSIGTSEGTVTTPDMPDFQTSGRRTFFRYRTGPTEDETVLADGRRFRISPQGGFYWKSVGIYAEYILSSQDVRLGAQQQTLSNRAWNATATYVLTGEKATPDGVVPYRPLDPRQGQWGAFELAARYSELRADNAAFPFFTDPEAARGARSWAVGLHWHFNKNVKLMLHYEQTDFMRNALGIRPSLEKLFIERIQLKF